MATAKLLSQAPMVSLEMSVEEAQALFAVLTRLDHERGSGLMRKLADATFQVWSTLDDIAHVTDENPYQEEMLADDGRYLDLVTPEE